MRFSAGERTMLHADSQIEINNEGLRWVTPG